MNKGIGKQLGVWVWAVAALAACDGGGGAGADGAGAEKVVTLTTGNSTIKDGGKFFTPLDNGTSTVALFSEQKDLWTLRNDTAAEITVDSITVKVDAGVAGEEFQIYDNAIPSKAADHKGVKVAAGGTYVFQIRFYPVAGGERKAVVTLAYDGSKKLTFGLTGKGQTSAKFFSGGSLGWEKLGGSSKGDDMTGTGVTDAGGVTYWNANVGELLDNFGYDVAVGAVGADGKSLWTKVFNGKYRDFSPDSGQNDETGGTGGSLQVGADGAVYVSASLSAIQQNNQFVAAVFKLDAKTGAMTWQKGFRNANKPSTASHSATAYGLDASGPLVLVTGVVEGDAKVLFAALDPASGDLKGSAALEVVKTVNDRGYAIRRDGKGGAYIGGLNTSAGAFVIHLKDADKGTPTIDWIQQLGLGKGSNINSIDTDADGNAYLSMDRRGAATAFSVGKMDSTGKLLWTKTWVGNGGDRENTAFARVYGSTVLVGGRMGIPNYDTTQGDGALLALATADGATLWSMFHFSGKGPDEIVDHRVKGASIVGKTLTIVTQSYTGTQNGVRYSGYWYDGEGEVKADTIDVQAVTGATVDKIAEANVVDCKDLGSWKDPPATWVWQDAIAKKDGKSPDADVMVTSITLK